MNKQAKLKQDQDVAKDDLTIILSYPHVYRAWVKRVRNCMTQENLVSVNENVNVVENSSKEKINKVSAKKAKAQSKANNIL